MKFKIVILFLFLLCISCSEPKSNSVFEGTYHCSGFDPYLNKSYTGTVVVKQQNTVYSIDMSYDTGESYRATGGQYDPTLMSVVFQDKNDLKRVGLEQYTLTNDKTTMQGYWVYLGEDKLGSEVCQKLQTEPRPN